MQYILAILLFVILYEVYLVVYYKYEDFRVNTYMQSLEGENERTLDRIRRKKEYFASVQTNAYIDRIMKSSQNRKNPGEDPLFLVDQKEVAGYNKLDTNALIVNTIRPNSVTYGMNNREKWAYYLFGIDDRQ